MTVICNALVEKAREVVEANRKAGRRIAVAESCTGGLVAAALTEIPGSSDVFEIGFVTYSNEAKLRLLGVRAQAAAAVPQRGGDRVRIVAERRDHTHSGDDDTTHQKPSVDWNRPTRKSDAS